MPPVGLRKRRISIDLPSPTAEVEQLLLIGPGRKAGICPLRQRRTGDADVKWRKPLESTWRGVGCHGFSGTVRLSGGAARFRRVLYEAHDSPAYRCDCKQCGLYCLRLVQRAHANSFFALRIAAIESSSAT